VLRFDMQKWTLFDASSSPVLGSVNSLATGSNGDILCAGAGVARYNGKSWVNIPDCPWHLILAVAEDSKGGVYAVNGAFGKYNLGWAVFDNTNSVFGGTGGMGDIEIDALGNKWIAGYQGLWVYNDKTVTNINQHFAYNTGEFHLLQNYPNPFNPSTTIRYEIPARSHVSLIVYNTLGQEVSLLQYGEQEAGIHEVRFDGTNLSSGVYFYRIQAGGFVQTKKLNLLR
jgi:hypothetical protein